MVACGDTETEGDVMTKWCQVTSPTAATSAGLTHWRNWFASRGIRTEDRNIKGHVVLFREMTWLEWEAMRVLK